MTPTSLPKILFNRRVKYTGPPPELNEKELIDQAWADDWPELPNWLAAATEHPKALWRRYRRHLRFFPGAPSVNRLLFRVVALGAGGAVLMAFGAGMLTRFDSGLAPLLFMVLGGAAGTGAGWLWACYKAYQRSHRPLYVSENNDFARPLDTTDHLEMMSPVIRWYDRQHDALNIENQMGSTEDAYIHLQMSFDQHIWDLRLEEELRGLAAANSDTVEGPLNDAWVQMEIHEEDGLLGNETRREQEWHEKLTKNIGLIAFGVFIVCAILQLVWIMDGQLLGRSDIEYRREQIGEMREDVRRQHQAAQDAANPAAAEGEER